MKQTIKLSENQLKAAIKESVANILREKNWDIDDKGIVNYDDNGDATNRSYADVHGIKRGTPSDVRRSLMTTPARDIRADVNRMKAQSADYPSDFSDDKGKWMRSSDFYAQGYDHDRFGNEFPEDINTEKPKGEFADSAFGMDKRPLHRKGSLNRELESKQRVRLKESQLGQIIREAVRKVIKEDGQGNLYGMARLNGVELYDRIDNALSKYFQDTHVSRFYSDENQITVAVSKANENRKDVIKLMNQFGYEYYTCGGNGDYTMMTFTRY